MKILASGPKPTANSLQHNDLLGLQGGTTNEYYHLTSAQHTDLTDSGDSSLHYHSSDRDRANHTGTQAASTISDFDTAVASTALLKANNLSDLVNTTTARDNLGVEIGSDVQAWDAALDDFSSLTQDTDKLPYFDSASTMATTTFTAFARTLLDDADQAAMQATLGLNATWVELAGDEMTGTLEIDINSDTNLLKLINNATQTNAVIVQRNSADAGNVSGLNGNGRWMSVGSTSSGFAITSSDFSTFHLLINHTTVSGTISNNTGALSVEGVAGSEIVINNLGADVNFRVEGDTEPNLILADSGLDCVSIGTTPSAVKKLTISQSTSGTGNPTVLVINGTQSAAAATTLKGATFNLFMTHTSGSLSGANITEFNFNGSGNGGTTSTIEGLNFNGSVGTGHTINTVNYIHLYQPTVSGTLSTLNALKIDAGHVIINDNQGDYDTRIEGDSLEYMLFLDGSAATENIALLATAAPNWQTMDRGLFIGNMTTAPTGNPTSGIFVYVDAGAGKARGTSGTITTWAPAEPHCPVCGSDFMLEWENQEKYGYLSICMKCLTKDIGEKKYIITKKRK